MPGLVSYNAQFHYNPQWGLLATAPGPPGPGRCATAVGPGAALALAGPDGRVVSYLPSAAALTVATLARCPLTVVNLGNLPAAPGRPGSPPGRRPPVRPTGSWAAAWPGCGRLDAGRRGAG